MRGKIKYRGTKKNGKITFFESPDGGFFVLPFSGYTISMPDNDHNPPKSPEELELEKQLAIAKLKNSITQEQANSEKSAAESRKAIQDAQKAQGKGPDVTALQGNITSDGTFIESRILARKTLVEAFVKLGKAIVEKSGLGEKGGAVDLVLYNAADIPYIELYAGIKRQVEMLDGHYGRMMAEIEKGLVSLAAFLAPATQPVAETRDGGGGGLETFGGPAFEMANLLPAVGALAAPGPVLAGYAAGAVLRTAIDLASLFRVDTDYKNFDLPIDDTALAAEFRKVIPPKWNLWHPAQFPVNTVVSTEADTSELLGLLEQVEEKNMQSASLSAEIAAKTKDLTAVLAMEQDASKRKDLQALQKKLADALDSIKAIDTAFAQVQGLLASADNATKSTTMNLILRAERLLVIMKKDGAYVVKLAAISRGSNKVTKWLWSSAVIRHSAGTELNCVIFSPTGELKFADTQLKYTPYIKAEDIKA
jgi:hypothetical protein